MEIAEGNVRVEQWAVVVALELVAGRRAAL